MIQAPASKSYLQRALAIALLAKGKTVLHNVSWCDDTMAVKNLIAGLGAKITEENRELIIQSEGIKITESLFSAEESGLALRMFAPIFALSGEKIQLSAKGTLKSRPIGFLGESLVQLGVSVTTDNGFPPLTISKKLNAGEITIDGSVSSQLLTGLLIALPLVDGNSIITVRNLKSIPYIDMTMNIIRHFGVEISHTNYQQFFIKGNQTYHPEEYTIEGDWSGAAFLLVAGALTGGVVVKNLSGNSLQADKKILDALKMARAKIRLQDNIVEVRRKKLQAFTFDATHCPDLFPPLATLAANCEGTTTIKGVSRLKHKESNRGEVLKTELSKSGISVEINDDLMKITGGKISGCIIDSQHDHRIAMMAGVLNLVSENEIIIKNKEAVNKSYPEFFVDLNKIGTELP